MFLFKMLVGKKYPPNATIRRLIINSWVHQYLNLRASLTSLIDDFLIKRCLNYEFYDMSILCISLQEWPVQSLSIVYVAYFQDNLHVCFSIRALIFKVFIRLIIFRYRYLIPKLIKYTIQQLRLIIQSQNKFLIILIQLKIQSFTLVYFIKCTEFNKQLSQLTNNNNISQYNHFMKDECYEFIKNQIGKPSIVGFGSYGEVKVAKNLSTNQIVAIKLIHGKNAKDEIDVHHKLNHPNIIKLINYYYEKQKNITYMVLQFAEGGSLNEKIKFGYGLLPKQTVLKYFKDMCQAIKYLHHHNYMHRDIKPQNILIGKNNVAKLCDFGFAAILQYRSTMCGTFEYMAPEMIKKRPYDYKIDIWALGILLFELIQGVAPFKGQTGQQVITQMKKPIKFSNRFSSIQIDLIKTILRVNSQNRPTIDQILQHSYFKDLKQQQKRQKQSSISTNINGSINTSVNTGINAISNRQQKLTSLQLKKQASRDNLLSKNLLKQQGFTSSKQHLLKFVSSNPQKQQNKVGKTEFGLRKMPSRQINIKRQAQTPQFKSQFKSQQQFQAHNSFSQISANAINNFIQSQVKINQSNNRQIYHQSTPLSPNLIPNYHRLSPTHLNLQEQRKKKKVINGFQPSFLSQKKMNFYNPNESKQTYNNTEPKSYGESLINNNKKVSLTQKLNYQKQNCSFTMPSEYNNSKSSGANSYLNLTINGNISTKDTQKNKFNQQNCVQGQVKKQTTYSKDGQSSQNKIYTSNSNSFMKCQFPKQQVVLPISNKQYKRFQKGSFLPISISKGSSSFVNNSIKTQPSINIDNSSQYMYTQKVYNQKSDKIDAPTSTCYNGQQYPFESQRRQCRPVINAKKE